VAVATNGYERILEISPRAPGRTYWISALEPEHFVPSMAPCPVWRIGQQVDLHVVLKHVTKIEPSDARSSLELKQPIKGSPHCLATAQVVQVLGHDCFTCSIEGASVPIKVECEMNYSLLVGQVVAFKAELAREA
jgi:hypothetical protein